MSSLRPSTKPSKNPGSLSFANKKVMLTARPDVPDFRDRLFAPTLIEVPPHRTVEQYRKSGSNPLILDQGQEGACTGFALAAVVNYLLRSRSVEKDTKSKASAHMLYKMARRYDEWPGENYEGSSARGAMKGWHRHGVCDDAVWTKANKQLTDDVQSDAIRRPLGSYYRVNHKDLISMHCAIAETGILYVTSNVHAGWDKVKKNGLIPFESGFEGGHAFVFVGYDDRGFWLQNSWGNDWGRAGYAHMSYEDWLANGNDAWVARLGAFMSQTAVSASNKSTKRKTFSASIQSTMDLRPHVITLGNDGRLKETDTYATTERVIADIFKVGGSFDTITKDWPKRRLYIHAHGGLIDDETAFDFAARTKDLYLKHGIYPLYIAWNSGLVDTFVNILEDAKRDSRAQGWFDGAIEWITDRTDSLLERVTAKQGHAFWSEMKENAERASETKLRDGKPGGLTFVVDAINKLAKRKKVDVHLCAHSAGSIMMGAFAKSLVVKTPVASLTFWAPACTMKFFKSNYAPLIKSGAIANTSMFVLSEKAEREDNCMGLYRKSLLYLVSRAFEEGEESVADGVELLGMQMYHDDSDLAKLIDAGKIDVIVSPNNEPPPTMKLSTSTSHGGFSADLSGAIASTAMRIAQV